MRKLIKKLGMWWEKLYNPVVNPKRIPCPKGYVVYHINGDKYDNHAKNLIVISRAELLRRNLGSKQ